MAVISRPGRAVVRFSGPEAHRLLEDVLTGPFHAGDAAGWWALLSPQGKIQAEGLAGFAENAWWLDVAQGVVEPFIRRMTMYRLRAKVEIADLRESHAVGWAPARPEAGMVHEDRRAGGLGFRVIAERERQWREDDAFRRARIEKGIAELGEDFLPDTNFPHDIAMDLNEGIDFVKGCYVGQEVVSRMKHRGTARRRPVIVSGARLETGAPVLAGGREAGTLGRVADGSAVAIIRLDRITDPGAAMVGDEPVALRLPDWAPYGFGESPGAD